MFFKQKRKHDRHPLPWKSLPPQSKKSWFLLDDDKFPYSKISPTYPWKVPRMFHEQFTKEFFLFGGLGKFGVSSKGMWAKSLTSEKNGESYVKLVNPTDLHSKIMAGQGILPDLPPVRLG